MERRSGILAESMGACITHTLPKKRAMRPTQGVEIVDGRVYRLVDGRRVEELALDGQPTDTCATCNSVERERTIERLLKACEDALDWINKFGDGDERIIETLNVAISEYKEKL